MYAENVIMNLSLSTQKAILEGKETAKERNDDDDDDYDV